MAPRVLIQDESEDKTNGSQGKEHGIHQKYSQHHDQAGTRPMAPRRRGMSHYHQHTISYHTILYHTKRILTASRQARGEDQQHLVEGTCCIFRSTPSSASVSPGLSCYLKKFTDKDASRLLLYFNFDKQPADLYRSFTAPCHTSIPIKFP